MKSKEFSIVIGVDAGYQGQTSGIASNQAAMLVSSKWQEIAANVFEKSGIYVGAAVTASAVVYHTDWGCPVGGERTVNIEGAANPQFTENLKKWQETVVEIAETLKKELKQSTVSIIFRDVDFVYLTD